MGSNRQRAWRLAVAAATLAVIAVAVPTAFAGGQKESDPNATASVDGGTIANIDVSITNTSTSGNITAQAFRVYIPSSMSVSNITGVVKKSGTGGTITPTVTTFAGATPYVEVLNATIARNATYTITITAKVPCNANGTVYGWVTDVRQSNDFNGTNNQIPTVNPDTTPALTTVSSGCSLVFTSQPKSATPGAVITDSAFNTSGGPVRVAVKSGGSSPVTVTWYTGNVSLATTPATALGGTASQPFASGVATFGDLTIATEGTYQLVASAAGVPDGTSSAFTIGYGLTTTCTAGDSQVCTTGTIPGPTGTTGSVTVNDSDGLTADLTAKFVGSNIDCPGYVEFGDNLYFNVTTANPSALSGLTKTVTVTKPIPAGRGSTTGADEWQYQLCFQSRAPFAAVPTFSSTPQTDYDYLLKALSNGDYTDPAATVLPGERVLGDLSQDEYRGLLPRCNLVANAAPCVQSVTFVGSNVTFVATVPAADPQMR